jgi:hypothetical protein
MNFYRPPAGPTHGTRHYRFLHFVLSCGVMMLIAEVVSAQGRHSLAGEQAAQELKESIQAEDYDLRYGPVKMRVGASVGVNYTDNVFYSDSADEEEDIMIAPRVTLDALWPVSELNTLRLSLVTSYEWYHNNDDLNPDAPLINPGTELTFNVFIGDVRIEVHERFSYEESLFYNTPLEGQDFFNFNDAGVFERLNNRVGLLATWDLNQLVLTAGYDHENFIPFTDTYEYMERASEWFTASAGYYLGDHFITGVEGQASWHDYEQETTLNDNWQGRVGPFVEVTPAEGTTLRAGAGFDTAQYDSTASESSDYETYYAYGRAQQRTRHFTHSLQAGRETLLGDNANNLRTIYARYSITTPVVKHVDLGANISINRGEEFGGAFEEEFTLYATGVQAGWQFHKYWRTGLAYEWLMKDSDLPDRDYNRNLVTLSLGWSF